MANGESEKTFSAKQVATKVGTDAKQLRKFFRDPNSGYTAVGQGGRYDFPESEIPKIAQAFKNWSATKSTRNRPANPEKKLASAAGLIPGQRKTSPKVDPKLGLHGNALDGDDLHTRMKGIKARVEQHGLTTTKQGRFTELPKPAGNDENEGLTDAQEIDFDSILAEVLGDRASDDEELDEVDPEGAEDMVQIFLDPDDE